MKKILTIAILLMATSSAFADINKANIFGICLDEGSVILMGDAAPDFADYSLGYTSISFNAIIGFGNRIGLHTGAGLLISYGSYVNGDVDSDITGIHYTSTDAKDDNSYGMAITIPAMARFYATNALFLEAGATFDINLFEAYYTGGTDEWDNRDDQKLLNVEVGGGIGFTLNFGLEFSFRYTYGLTDMYEDIDMTDSRISLGIGYWFNYK